MLGVCLFILPQIKVRAKMAAMTTTIAITLLLMRPLHASDSAVVHISAHTASPLQYESMYIWPPAEDNGGAKSAGTFEFLMPYSPLAQPLYFEVVGDAQNDGSDIYVFVVGPATLLPGHFGANAFIMDGKGCPSQLTCSEVASFSANTTQHISCESGVVFDIFVSV